MKKFLMFFMCFITIFSFGGVLALADEVDPPVQTDAPLTYTLSLQDAINMAFKDNEQIKANEIKQTANKISVNNAYLSRKPYKNMTVNVSKNFEIHCMKEGYYIKAAEMAERLSKNELEKIKSSISYNVTSAYYNVVLMDKLVGASQYAYDMAKNNMEVVSAQYNLGLIAGLDYDNAKVSVDAAKNSLDTNLMNKELAVENLKILLKLDGTDCVLVLTDEIECDEYTSDVNRDIELAMDSRYDLTALKENADLAYEYFDIAEVLSEGSATYNTAYSSYVDAKYNYDNTKKLLAVSIKGAYNNVISSKSSMEIAESQYLIQLRTLNAAKLKYELGVITNMELTKAISDLYSAQTAFANAKLSYRMAIEKYKCEITTGL